MQSLFKKKLLLLLFIINIHDGIEWFEMTKVMNLIFPVLAIRDSSNHVTLPQICKQHLITTSCAIFKVILCNNFELTRFIITN